MAIGSNDTTTTLYPGVGGDTMAESLLTLADGSTQAKAPRVVLASDDGSLVGKLSPLAVSLCQDDRVLLETIRDLLSQLVSLQGGLT